jgi:hypothetical protein
MKIADLLHDLRRAKPDAEVRFDFAGCAPTKVGSSRGDYSQPALGWCATSYSGSGKAPTVAELIAELERATDGRKYTGWKGGEYTFTPNDPLCVDNPGDWTDTQLVRVEDQEWRVILHTRMEG